MNRPVRVRFAPSPTGGLHLGGVRTALYNYLFAKKHNGTFVLRIEDTDQTRYVAAAEQYIIDTLAWCNISADEGPHQPGNFGPYRQSERKEIYKQYAEQLIKNGYAYYAFDTPEALEKMRETHKSASNPSPQYDCKTRMQMRNSLSLPSDEVNELLRNHTPYVVRIKMPENETVSFTDMIRGVISNQTELVDDKVLLKADGMPTYHLAVVVDDYLMQISHAFRGEEWLPSAPVHVLLWKYLGWEKDMPQWAHLPLILKPDGNGKLNKRDGDRLGFPVFAMDWQTTDGEIIQGFKEKGFLPGAFVNLLAMLGWNDGTEKEIFTLNELAQSFDMERVHKAGAKFNYDKALWYNQEWIKILPIDIATHDNSNHLFGAVKNILTTKGLTITNDMQLATIIGLVRERCTLLADFYTQCVYFYATPTSIDFSAIQPKWNEDKRTFFSDLIAVLQNTQEWHTTAIETEFKQLAEAKQIKVGELQLPLRLMLVGGKYGPNVFTIAELIGRDECLKRISNAIELITI